MPHIKMNKKTLLIVGAGVALVVIYMYMRSKSAASTTPTDTLGTVPQDLGAPGTGGFGTSGGASGGATDTSGLAQSSDLAAFQGQEAQDIAALQGMIGANQAGEQSDVGSILGQLGALTQQVAGIPAGATGAAGKRGKRGPAGKSGRKHKHPTGKHPARGHDPSHTNHHHPAGTGGAAVASRSHHPRPKHKTKHTGWHTHTRRVPHERRVNKGTARNPRWVIEHYFTTEQFQTPYTYWT